MWGGGAAGALSTKVAIECLTGRKVINESRSLVGLTTSQECLADSNYISAGKS